MSVKCVSCESSIVECDVEAGASSCWCMSYPQVMELDVETSCLCASCLTKKIGTKTKQIAVDYKHGVDENIALKSAHLKAIEGIDYYMENGFFVMKGWSHLKRGNCCGNKCRHCPYDYINVAR